MSNHITVIDIEVGDPTKGYAVRVGTEISKDLRLAGCYHAATGNLVKTAGNSYDALQKTYTPYSDYNQAAAVAKSLQARLPGYKVRIDCTIA
jgi:hypothetical protein